MTEPRWLARRTVDAIHEEQIVEHGGANGLRDGGLLDSALSAPQQQYAYSSDDAFNLAATYAERIAKNHPFIDGNKRTAFLAAYTFLAANGYELMASEEEATERTLALAAGGIGQQEYAAWPRANTTKDSG